MSELATAFLTPVKFGAYTVSLSVVIPSDFMRVPYFQRAYFDRSGNLLGIRATLITNRGFVCLTDLGAPPEGTHYLEADVRAENNATLPDPIPVQETSEQGITFATGFDVPVMFGTRQLNLSLFFSDNPRTTFLERTYLDAMNRVITVRSHAVFKRGEMITFNINHPAPPPGTRFIEVQLHSNYTGLPETEEGYSLEYEPLEYNDIEYN